jgi:hypothetical protein
MLPDKAGQIAAAAADGSARNSKRPPPRREGDPAPHYCVPVHSRPGGYLIESWRSHLGGLHSQRSRFRDGCSCWRGGAAGAV